MRIDIAGSRVRVRERARRATGNNGKERDG